ncbi:DNA gyrase/topoisomerase IV subunit A [Ichthyobacterium seriolicida]|uniref:DNA topoisomerase n=1 Tax=Ichthyobacterium seriolicida TaxID=242600 RepID=A0A1J1DZY7_9FLAO|nr:DNA gyrase/topoisomerase IV subunit A [Ichthyobacterium seriolicida]BAV95473.1 DNA topoisomerase [Ichthyobacterium seriolicida]
MPDNTIDLSIKNDTSEVTEVSGMYRNWFLDYASYVILERAIPTIEDGLKPVQRRILHSLYELNDGRYNKVANIVGNTMKYHPHGDASIFEATVQLGQKNFLIDTQGNWGNILTGDKAAAARYIEARLSEFALDVVFNPKVTVWQKSYDGRNNEPITLPIKFPLLLAQGVEGIAVGLSTKIMPHNFIELIDASIQNLKGIKTNIYPDFPTKGLADFTDYKDGLRGGKIKMRARISQVGKGILKITEIPYGMTTSSLIESIIKANDKGKVRIKKIEDNTAEDVEILIYLHNSAVEEKIIDALYAFTDCELSLSPISCVIENEKPVFLGVSEILYKSTENTKQLLYRELEIKLEDLREQWHFSTLERIFIVRKIYRNIEEKDTWEDVISAIDKGLKPYVKQLIRDITKEDIVKLTEIRIKRISKFDIDKSETYIKNIEKQIKETEYNLKNIVDFTIQYFTRIKTKYKNVYKGRKTEIKTFDNIDIFDVAISNTKLYFNKTEGFIGTSLKDESFALECSDIDDIIVFKKDGTFLVTKVDSKTFVGKDIIHIQVFKKGNSQNVYNVIYEDGETGISYKKRFNVLSVTRDKEYDITQGTKGSKVIYFSANPKSETEVVTVHLKKKYTLMKSKFEVDFSQLSIKGKNVKGNIVTKYSINKIKLK